MKDGECVFKIGDRVMLAEDGEIYTVFEEQVGDIGTIVNYDEPSNNSSDIYVVNYDKNIGSLHDGDMYGRGAMGHCVIYFLSPTQAENCFKKIQKNRKNNFY